MAKLTERQKEDKYIKQAIKRIEQQLNKDESIIEINIPKNILDKIDRSNKNWAEQVRELTTVKVKSANIYGTSETRTYGAAEAGELIKAAEKAYKNIEKLKREDPDLYKEMKARNANIDKKKTIGSLSIYRGKEYTKKTWAKSPKQAAEERTKIFIKNLGKSLKHAGVKDASTKLYNELMKAARKYKKPYELENLLKSTGNKELIQQLYSSDQALVAQALRKLAALLKVDKEEDGKTDKVFDGKTIEEIAMDLKKSSDY